MPEYTVSITLQGRDNASDEIARVRREMSSLDDQTSRVSRTNTQVSQSFTGLGDAARNTVLALGAVGIAQAGLELVNLGEQVNDATLRFQAYTSGLDANGDLLERLRTVTRGAASDMTLMSNAAMAVATGVAGTEEEISQIIEIGSTLGGGTAGVEALVGVLKNGLSAMERLDEVNLSATAVRARFEELKESGIETGEALRMAVIAEGQAQLERYGDTLGQQTSAFDRLKVIGENAMNSIGSAVNNVLNQAITTAEQLGYLGQIIYNGGVAPEQAAVQQQAEDDAAAWAARVATRVNSEFTGVFAPELAARLMENAIAIVNADPAMMGDVDALVQQAWSESGQPLQLLDEATFNNVATLLNETLVAQQNLRDEQALNAANQQLQADIQADVLSMYQMQSLVMAGQLATGVQMAAQEAARLNAIERAQALSMETFRVQERGADANVEAWETTNRLMDEAGEVLGNIQADYSTITGDGSLLLTPDEYSRIQSAAAEYDAILADAEYANEMGLMSDDDLLAIQSSAEYVSMIADDAQRGADDFERMAASLDLMLGRGDGGVATEIGDDVFAYLESTGRYSQEELEAMRSRDRLSTGEETQLGQAYDEQFTPLLGEILATYGQDAFDAARRNLQEYLLEAQTQGLSDEEIIAGAGNAIGYRFSGSGGGQSIVVNPGDTISGLAAQYGMSPEQLMAAINISNPYMLQPGTYETGGMGDVVPIAESSAEFSNNMTQAREDLDLIKEGFSELTADVQVVRTRIDIENWQELETKVLGIFANLVRSNGGTVPGADERRGGGIGGR